MELIKSFEYQYADSLENCFEKGIDTSDRTGVGRKRFMGQHFVIGNYPGLDMLPVLRGKKVFPKMAIKEMTWILSGHTNIDYLEKHGVTYWREWANANGELGRVYGAQMRDFNGFDQIRYMLDNLVNKPESSQTMISLWNPSELHKMALPPCHFLYHFIVIPENGINYLHLHFVQRSADSFLGVPYNAIMAKYFLIIMAKFTGYEIGNIYWTLNDYHIYMNHESQVIMYLGNVREDKFKTVGIDTMVDIEGLIPFTEDEKRDTDLMVSKFDNFLKYCDEQMFKNITVRNIESYPPIVADIAV